MNGRYHLDDGLHPDAPHDDLHDDVLDELVHRADLDGLVRLVDDRCATRDWPGLRRLRDRCRAAVRTGRQLWPAATLAEYRLALLAPAAEAAAMIDDDAGRFTIGPLTEVIAQHHSWDELEPHLPSSPASVYVAHERVVRGEDVDPASLRRLPPVLDLPLTLRAWEPDYPLATYRDHLVETPAPALAGAAETITTVADAERLDDDVDLAVRQLVEPWTSSSTGRAETVCVVGGAAEALGALGPSSARLTPLRPDQAIAWLAWAGASGGAHGRRRGAAAGRFGAWWTLAAIADRLDDWPVDPDVLGEVAHELRWSWWDTDEPRSGWRLQLTVEDPGESVAWAVLARDDA